MIEGPGRQGEGSMPDRVRTGVGFRAGPGGLPGGLAAGSTASWGEGKSMFSWKARGDRPTRWRGKYRGPTAGAGLLALVLCLVVGLAERDRAQAQVPAPEAAPGNPLAPPSQGIGRVSARDLLIGKAAETPARVEQASAAGDVLPGAVPAPASGPPRVVVPPPFGPAPIF